VAARKVAEENKKLRVLLNKHGVLDESIEHFLISGIVPPSGNHAVASQFRSAIVGSNVGTLEQLLEPRRPNCIDPSTPFCPVPSSISGVARVTDSGGQASREASVTMWDAVTSSSSPLTRNFPTTLPSQSTRIQPGQQFLTPNTTPTGASRNDSLALQGLGTMMDDPRTSDVTVSPVSATGDGQSQGGYGYDIHLLPSPSGYSTPQHRRQRLAVQTPTCVPSPISPTYIPTTSSPNNCGLGSDLMATMAGDEASVRASLGCVPGLDYQVDNVHFANAMDRYTAAAIGM
jgi:hypothetical protein